MKIIKTVKYKKIAYDYNNSSSGDSGREEIIELIIQVANGNIGAASVLRQLFDRGEVELIKKLLEKGIIGSNIWIKYKDEYGGDIEMFIQELRAM